MKKVKVYHGMKGERITMVEKQNRRLPKTHCFSYEQQQRKDLLFAALFCFAIAIGCLVLLLNTQEIKMDPTTAFNALYREFLKWKSEPIATRGNWLHRKALYFKKNRIWRKPLRSHRKARNSN